MGVSRKRERERERERVRESSEWSKGSLNELVRNHYYSHRVESVLGNSLHKKKKRRGLREGNLLDCF